MESLSEAGALLPLQLKQLGLSVERLLAVEDFEQIPGFRLSEEARMALSQDGISTPTALQGEAIPSILAGRSAVLYSGTGTGKTLAYLLPLLERLRKSPEGRTVVFSPTTELAMQTLKVANRYGDPGLRTGALVAEVNFRSQNARIQKSTRFIVGTPGRILEEFARRRLKKVTTIVLDEPDPILASKGGDFLMEVLSRPEPRVQLILAAATLGPRAEAVVAQSEKMGDEPMLRLTGDHSPLQANIRHYAIHVGPSGARDVTLARVIQENRIRRAIVFANQPASLGHLYRYFNEHDLPAISLYHERSKGERDRALRQFRNSEARVLVASDRSTRGLDIPELDWVLHYDLPHSAEAYVHRAGRTGRAGNFWRSMVLVTRENAGLLRRYSTALNLEFKDGRQGNEGQLPL